MKPAFHWCLVDVGTWHLYMLLYMHLSKDVGLDIEEDSTAIEQARSEIRQRYIDVIVTSPVDSVDSLDQTNAVLWSVLRRSREVNLAAQVRCSTCKQRHYYHLACLQWCIVHTCTRILATNPPCEIASYARVHVTTCIAQPRKHKDGLRRHKTVLNHLNSSFRRNKMV